MKLEKGKMYIVDLGYKYNNSTVLAEYTEEVRVDKEIFGENNLLGYSVTPVRVVKDRSEGLVKHTIGCNMCVDMDQIKEVK